ncbi:1-acyl-sn-glycerol-3-phosphate acyltransferase [Salana multivorans]|uniref:1-acyl-sn-glycerol-3-phosphate acyltransferase n=1 Tax=Salana multivorans TaxID=120377 RepID=UPI000ADA6E3A|nr:1-acyl-sn-glycerol-3-phosphate acyltransferase [Salana multivorans]
MIRRSLARLYWRLSRWALVSEPQPPATTARVIIGTPHTSNWDGVLMVAIAWTYDIELHWLGKKQLFAPPLGLLTRALGGIPVDRANPGRLVEEIVAGQSERPFSIVVTPEGTRRGGGGWKSGFYRIAREADLPVTLGYVDRDTMTCGLGPTIELTGDVGADMDVIRAFYADKSGLRPANRSEPRLAQEPRGGDDRPVEPA